MKWPIARQIIVNRPFPSAEIFSPELIRRDDVPKRYHFHLAFEALCLVGSVRKFLIITFCCVPFLVGEPDRGCYQLTCKRLLAEGLDHQLTFVRDQAASVSDWLKLLSGFATSSVMQNFEGSQRHARGRHN